MVLEEDKYVLSIRIPREFKSGVFVTESVHIEYKINYNGLLFEGYVNAFETVQNQTRIQNLKDNFLIAGAWLAGLYGVFEIAKWATSYFQTYICHCVFFLEK